MRKVRLTRRAEADLEEIWSFIGTDSVSAADQLLEKIAAVLGKLARFPHLGRRRPELTQDLRSFAVGEYIVFYRATAKRLDVVRILSGYRDIGSLFGRE